MRLLVVVAFLSGVVSSAFVGTAQWRDTRQFMSNEFYSFRSEEQELSQIRSMTVRELQAELVQRKQSTRDVFEKEQLVQRLFEARRSSLEKATATGTSPPVSNPSSTRSNDNDIIQIPLFLTYMDDNVKIAASNIANGGGIIVEAGTQPFPTIQITVKQQGDDFNLNLLLDTACTGFVLRPEIVSKYNLPRFTTPVTMTGAGGTAGSTGLSQLESFMVGNQSFGPLPAAVQDIGALPKTLDGIIGLSFLSQFACVEMDFLKGVVRFFREAPPIRDDLRIVAETELKYISGLGIYSVDVYIGGRGPVQMIFDTGASASFLSWKGVADLGLSKDSNFVQPLSTRMGAMGSDNIAIQLSHRININSKIEIGKPGKLPGIILGSGGRLSMDIGVIPLLQTLENKGVGGILGIDVLSRCAVVRFQLGGYPPVITLFQDSQVLMNS